MQLPPFRPLPPPPHPLPLPLPHLSLVYASASPTTQRRLGVRVRTDAVDRHIACHTRTHTHAHTHVANMSAIVSTQKCIRATFVESLLECVPSVLV